MEQNKPKNNYKTIENKRQGITGQKMFRLIIHYLGEGKKQNWRAQPATRMAGKPAVKRRAIYNGVRWKRRKFWLAQRSGQILIDSSAALGMTEGISNKEHRIVKWIPFPSTPVESCGMTAPRTMRDGQVVRYNKLTFAAGCRGNLFDLLCFYCD